MSHPLGRLTVLLTAGAYLLVTLDALVVVTALPSIHADLGGTAGGLPWIINAYALTFASGIITAAALGDRLGRRRTYAVGLTLFSLASAACALAPNLGILIATRAVQGLGAAIVMPLGLTLLTAAFPAERRGAVVGIWGGVAGLGVASGPLVGGAVTEGLDWHWVFWVNVPLPDARSPGADQRRLGPERPRALRRRDVGPTRRPDRPDPGPGGDPRADERVAARRGRPDRSRGPRADPVRRLPRAVAFASAGSGLHHKIAHVLGGMFDLAHAETHAVVLPHVLALNAPAVPDLDRRMAGAFGADSALGGLLDLEARLGAPTSLRSLGMPESGLATAVQPILDASPPNNPAPVTSPVIEALLRAAWDGKEPA